MSADGVLRLQVTDRRQLTANVIELTLATGDAATALPPTEPGAHIDLRLGAELVRQYSLVNPSQNATDWKVAILVDHAGRGGSKLISDTLHVGSSVAVSGPRNHFRLVKASSYLFVAGGIGVTPMIPMCAEAEKAGAEWRLVYAGRDRVEMAYLDELEARWPGKVEVFDLSQGQLFPVAKELPALPSGTHVYVCGPEGLLDAAEDSMAAAGRTPEIHTERFSPRDAASFAEPVEFTVFAAKSDVEFVVPADESILMAADFEGIAIEGDCMEGTCGSCVVPVLEGAVEHRDSVLDAAARSKSDCLMICVSRAAQGCNRLILNL